MSSIAPRHPPIVRPLGDVTTGRLRLRRFAADDLDGLASVFAHPQVWQFPYGRAFSRDETAAFLEDQMAEWATCGFGCWAAVDRGTDRIVGYLGLSVPGFLLEILPAVEVGWRLHPSVWGKGLAQEGAAAALDEAFSTLGLAEVCSVPQSDNPASVRVAQRLGMRLEREVRVPANERRGALAASLFRITADEWARLRHGGVDARG